MKSAFGAALRAAILCSAAIAVSACVYEPRGHYGYGEAGYYEDPCDQDRAYCGYPMYEGGIYVDGNWYEGRHRYRENNGRREYYLHGNWYGADQTRDRDHDWRDHDRTGGHDWHDRDHDNNNDRGNWRDRDHDNDRNNDRDGDHNPRQLHDHDRDHDNDRDGRHDNDQDDDGH